MRWAPIIEKPPKPGAYFCWHLRYGKCVMGWNDGWGPTGDANVMWWLQEDQCPEQQTDGSFANP